MPIVMPTVMRHLLRAAAAAATAAVCLLPGTVALAGPAAAQDRVAGPAGARGLHAPSDLVLAVGRGEDTATATVERSVTLSCATRPTGTHPDPDAACAQLASVDGRFDELAGSATDVMCTKEWDPMVVSASGVWEGRRVNWSATYANSCRLHADLARSATLAF